jgi:hypothetical protein
MFTALLLGGRGHEIFNAVLHQKMLTYSWEKIAKVMLAKYLSFRPQLQTVQYFLILNGNWYQ